MGWKEIAAAIAAIFNYLLGRQQIAGDPVLKKNKAAQQDQDIANEIDRLTQTAMTDSDPLKRVAAAEKLRKMDSE